MNADKSRLWIPCLVCLLAGCHITIIDLGEADRTPFQFPDDADPALAAVPFVETQLLVQPYPGADARTLSDLYAEAGATVLDRLDEIQLTVLDVPAGQLNEIAGKLDAAGLVETLAKNRIFEPSRLPNDPLFPQQPHLAQINAPAAWDETVGDDRIIIAVIDTGIDANHPDLAAKLLAGWDIRQNNSDAGDVLGHGTHVAGVAAAVSNNGTGVTGVSWESSILPIRVTDDEGYATAWHLAAAILWAVAHDAKIINVSFAPLWSNPIVQAAAQHAFHHGAVVVISAGNNGGTTTAEGYREALFVGAVDASDQIAFFSDRGSFVDLVAPGIAVRSTWIGSEYGLETGTSFAAPIVSGVAALTWAANPDLGPTAIQAAILDTAIDLGSNGKDGTFGHGLVDARAAVLEAASAVPIRDATLPRVTVAQPAANSRLSGRFVTTAIATDSPSSGGVAQVALSIDDVPYATDVRAPYRFVIDTAAFSTGTHELAFVATDLAGNVSPTTTLRLTFGASTAGGALGRPTAIVFTSPASGATVSGTVAINANVSDQDGLATVEWLLDGDSVLVSSLSGQSSRVTYAWRAMNSPSGRHTITLVVTDTGGRRTESNLDLIRR